MLNLTASLAKMEQPPDRRGTIHSPVWRLTRRLVAVGGSPDCAQGTAYDMVAFVM